MFYVVIVLQFLLYTLFCTVTIHKIIKNIITFLSHIIFLCLFNTFYFFYYYRKYIMLVLPCTMSFIMYGMHPTKMPDLTTLSPQKVFSLIPVHKRSRSALFDTCSQMPLNNGTILYIGCKKSLKTSSTRPYPSP